MSEPTFFSMPSIQGDLTEEVTALYREVMPQYEAFNRGTTGITDAIRLITDRLPPEVAVPVYQTALELFMGSIYLRPLAPPRLSGMSTQQIDEYRWELYAKRAFYANPNRLLTLVRQRIVETLADFKNIGSHIGASPFKVSIGALLPDPAESIDRINERLTEHEVWLNRVFRPTAQRLFDNRIKNPSTRKVLTARDSNLPTDELIDRYLAGTPYHTLFKTKVPLKLTHEERFSHMHLVAGSGGGKTSLIEHLIIHDLKSDDPPTIVLIDPHSDLIQRLIHADLGIEDRLIYINPRDTKYPPALNIFAVNRKRLAGYDEATREQVTAGVLDTFSFLFSGLFDMDLTGKQQVFFSYVARLLLSMPDTMGRNATILDMLNLIADPAPYLPAIHALPPIQREFFQRDFVSKTFAQTREQIRYRLQGIIGDPTLARLFTSPETKVDLFTEMNRGAVIVVDTAKDFLKSGSKVFARLFVSLILQAVQERAAIPEHKRKATFLIVDEAADVFDTNVSDLLTDARKYRCGVVLSHQFGEQGTSALRAALTANTAIKLATSVSSADARWLAPDMRTTPDFILAQPKLQFACHIRGVTPHAVSINVRPGALAALPRLSEAAFEALMERNRARVSMGLPAAPERPSASAWQPLSPDPDEDIAAKW